MTGLKIAVWMFLALNISGLSAAPNTSRISQHSPPKDNGPDLTDTLTFIQNKLNDRGKINFVVFFQDTTDGSTWNVTQFEDLKSVSVDPLACKIGYNSTTSVVSYENNAQGSQRSVFLKAVTKLAVMSYQDALARSNASSGIVTRVATNTSPAVFTLRVLSAGNVIDSFEFLDDDDANRVAKAMLHATELCGGGSKDPF